MTDLLRDFSDFIDDLADREPFDPVTLRLPAIESQLSGLLAKLRERIDTFRTAQRNMRTWRAYAPQPRVIAQPPSASVPNPDTNWTVVRARRRPRETSRKSADKTAIPRAPLPHRARDVDIPVSSGMSLRATEIASTAEIRADGVLYYLPHTRRFALRFAGGLILQGNIGIVYTSDPSPQKIHDCDSQLGCNIATCRYYHNPAIYPGSQDIRNFATTSWLYRPTSSTCMPDRAHNPQKKARKLASRDRLDADILTITQDDLAYFNEQLMHDILCGLIMNYYVRTGF